MDGNLESREDDGAKERKIVEEDAVLPQHLECFLDNDGHTVVPIELVDSLAGKHLDEGNDRIDDNGENQDRDQVDERESLVLDVHIIEEPMYTMLDVMEMVEDENSLMFHLNGSHFETMLSLSRWLFMKPNEVYNWTASDLMEDHQVLEGSQQVDLSSHPSGIVPTLQNIVSTVNLDCKLDLKAIALQARNAEYNPKVFTLHQNSFAVNKFILTFGCFQRFAAVIMRIREQKTTALIFASGKMVCTGAKSEAQSKLAARKYEPEVFPGLIYRMKQPKIVLLIFVSEKIVLTGAKVVICNLPLEIETYTAFENIYPVLTGFRKEQSPKAMISLKRSREGVVRQRGLLQGCRDGMEDRRSESRST
ncbi:hypothetical protein SASPL_131220 [Salvia splendens]|uniref:Transcription initiation factor TFIID TATA-box-binding protein n=1 Tax=Salvia splendens TaxID=180675 RepID=A0A8X8X729_SALSN|nr:hypothetical protein SASPL_131220 [Salvia splendens]